MESSVEASIETMEQDIEQSNVNMERILTHINAVENAIKELQNDDSISSSLEQNLESLEVDKQSEVKKRKQLLAELHSLLNELSEIKSINEESKSEIRALKSIDEDVSDAEAIIGSRETSINTAEARIHELINMLHDGKTATTNMNGNQTVWSWHSYDIDSTTETELGYCVQTDIHVDGSVHRYSATNGNFEIGHGHKVFSSMTDYHNDENEWTRSPNDKKSIGRRWKDRT